MAGKERGGGILARLERLGSVHVGGGSGACVVNRAALVVLVWYMQVQYSTVQYSYRTGQDRIVYRRVGGGEEEREGKEEKEETCETFEI